MQRGLGFWAVLALLFAAFPLSARASARQAAQSGATAPTEIPAAKAATQDPTILSALKTCSISAYGKNRN